MYSDIDKIMKGMMLDYLENAYPISRIKHEHKFRRAIVLDKGVYILGDHTNHIQLKNSLAQDLKIVFYCDDATAFAILDNFLNLKKQSYRLLK